MKSRLMERPQGVNISLLAEFDPALIYFNNILFKLVLDLIRRRSKMK